MTKVLLVDDVYTARSMIGRVLHHVGRYEVYSVNSGSDALAFADLNTMDVIILDISMAGMDGLATLHTLRTHGVRCPVVAYTARSEQDLGEFVSQGFSAYVPKNGNLSELLAKLRDLIGR